MVKAQWISEEAEDAYDILCRKIHTDAMPVGEEKRIQLFLNIGFTGIPGDILEVFSIRIVLRCFLKNMIVFIENPMDFFL